LQTKVYIPSFANCVRSNKPKDTEANTVVYGLVKAWIFCIKEQYLVFFFSK